MISMKKDKGFTLLELAIAISIFGILMLSFSQLLRSEIRLMNTASEKNRVEEKARTTMMRILDEIRVNQYTLYSPNSAGYNEGVYKNPPAPSTKTVLINVNPDPTILATLHTNPSGVSPGIYYDGAEGNLWYCDGSRTNLIADQVYVFGIQPDPTNQTHLVKIFLGIGEPYGDYYDLLTWVRLY